MVEVGLYNLREMKLQVSKAIKRAVVSLVKTTMAVIGDSVTSLTRTKRTESARAYQREVQVAG